MTIEGILLFLMISVLKLGQNDGVQTKLRRVDSFNADCPTIRPKRAREAEQRQRIERVVRRWPKWKAEIPGSPSGQQKGTRFLCEGFRWPELSPVVQQAREQNRTKM